MTYFAGNLYNILRSRRLYVEVLEDRNLLATFPVTNLLDGPVAAPGDLPGSLRQAIYDANNMPGSDSIDLTGVSGTLLMTDGEFAITDTLNIFGSGSGVLAIDGQQQTRLLNVEGIGIDLTINGLTLRNGRTTGDNSDYSDSTYSGGGVRFMSDGILAILGSTVSGSSTSGSHARGAGVYSNGTLTLTESVVTGNSTRGAFARGGGIYAKGEVTLNQSTISNNYTQQFRAYGGGILAYDTLTVTNSTISGNYTLGNAAQGGGVFAYGVVSLADSTLSGNYTVGPLARGGGLVVNGFETVTLTKSTVSGNHTRGEHSPGGAIYSYGSMSLIQSTISGNHTEGDSADGGAVFINSASATLFETTVSGNYTTGVGSGGGGIYSSNDVTLTGSTISGNYTSEKDSGGGGIYAYSATVIESTISGNHTHGFRADGGGIYASGPVTLNQSTVSSNYTTGSMADGGGVYAFNPVTLTQSTITGNEVRYSDAIGGGIRSSIDPIDITGSILAGNTAAGGMNDISPGTSMLTINFSLIGDADGLSIIGGNNQTGTAANPLDPLVGSLADNGGPTHTHALLPGSPALDASNSTHVTDQRGLAVPVDLVGVPNAAGGNGSDMGAYEAQTAPSADYVDDDLITGLDFLAWQHGAGTTSGATRNDGDSDGDGDVDSSDLAAWEATYGQAVATPLVAALSSGQFVEAATVSEPLMVVEASPEVSVSDLLAESAEEADASSSLSTTDTSKMNLLINATRAWHHHHRDLQKAGVAHVHEAAFTEFFSNIPLVRDWNSTTRASRFEDAEHFDSGGFENSGDVPWLEDELMDKVFG